ncbi:unnamed protein product [Victoria cruziana]
MVAMAAMAVVVAMALMVAAALLYGEKRYGEESKNELRRDGHCHTGRNRDVKKAKYTNKRLFLQWPCTAVVP